MVFMEISEVGDLLGEIKQRLWPTPEYKIETTPRGLILSLDGKQLITSSVLDRDYFVKDWFTAPELEIAARFEYSNQQILKKVGPRICSGLYSYSHIDRMVGNTFRTAQKADAPLDSIILLTSIGHERVEEDERVRELNSAWEKAYNEGDNITRVDLEEKLRQTRVEVKNETQRELLRYIRATGVKGSERDDLVRKVETVARQIYHLTRFSNERAYSSSMEYQYSRVSKESIEDMFRRIIVKNKDMRTNAEEYGPMFLMYIMKQMGLAFKDKRMFGNYEIGKELTTRFGGIRLNGKEMPPAVRVVTSFNSLLPLHFQNKIINKYTQDIRDGKYGEGASELLKLVELSKNELIEAITKLNNSAIVIYESNKDIVRIKPEVDRAIEEDKKTDYYYKAQAGASIQYWLSREPKGREFISSLDTIPEEMAKIYRTARDLRENIPMFAMFQERSDDSDIPTLLNDPKVYDPAKHRYFTLRDVEKLTSLMPNYLSLKRTPSSRKTDRGRSLLF